METTWQTANWIARARQPGSHEETARLLTEILGAPEETAREIEELARAKDCRSVFRRAAVDRYVELRKDGAENLLWELTNFEEEGDEEMRVLAYLWLCSLQTAKATTLRFRGAVKTRRAVRPPRMFRVSTSDWRQRAAKDPSPRVQWLASLGIERGLSGLSS